MWLQRPYIQRVADPWGGWVWGSPGSITLTNTPAAQNPSVQIFTWRWGSSSGAHQHFEGWEKHKPTAGWQSQMQRREGGRRSVVIEILSEQNLVCVIIVHQAPSEAKIHSTWCIHCFSQTQTRPSSGGLGYCTTALAENNRKQPKANCILRQRKYVQHSGVGGKLRNDGMNRQLLISNSPSLNILVLPDVQENPHTRSREHWAPSDELW